MEIIFTPLHPIRGEGVTSKAERGNENEGLGYVKGSGTIEKVKSNCDTL